MKESVLKGKRILIIALPGYSDGIIQKMHQMGAEVDFLHDKPNERFLCKTLGRLQIKSYLKIIDKYYEKQISNLASNKYDYILVIRGEYTTKNALIKIRQTFTKAKMILYMWDGMHKQNTRGIEGKWKYFDKVYTFDRVDYEENKEAIDFLPLYYYEDYLPNDLKKCDSTDIKYDISFIGTGHADRVKIVKDIMQQSKKCGKNVFSYIFMPHLLVYIINKIVNKDFEQVSANDIKYKKIPFEQLYKVYGDSRCVLDVENPGQHGLTMRTIEILGLKRKLITTNTDIVNYDFYNSNNILVIDRNNPKINLDFLEKPYEELDDNIYKKYSLSNWILEVLK